MIFLPLPWFYESVLIFRGSNKMGYQINCSSFINNGWCFILFPHSYWNCVSLHLMKAPVGLVVMWISHLSAIRALGVYGSIGTKYIKIHLELHFLLTSLCLYIFMYYTFCVCLYIYMQQDFWKSSKVFLKRSVYVQNLGYSKGRYIYLVLIVDLLGFYCKVRCKSTLNEE